MATFLTTIFYSATYPYIHKEIMSVASDNLIALNQIINCVSVIICGWMWNNKSDKLFEWYPIYCVLETVLGIITTIYAIVTQNIIAYYLLDTIVFAVVTRNIFCGGVKLRAIRYNSEEKREHFDNNNNSASSLATIFGSIIAIFLNLDFKIMLCIATFGNIIDNLFYIFIFYYTKEIGRLSECVTCEYFKVCLRTVTEPEDYADGTCKTKDTFRSREEETGGRI